MLWLIWQIWIFLFIAFGLGLGLGWRLWSASGETGKALQDAQEQIGRLQRENDSLTRLVAQRQADSETAGRAKPAVAARSSSAKAASEPVKTGAVRKASAAKPKPAAKAKPAKPDDLTELKGLGPKAAEALKAGGVTTFAQIAAWSKKDIAAWDEKLTARGRITRDDWVGQAKAKTG
ncbi:helix-hairpin-helix domain-containing protein [Hyphobacterium sp.]|uniref:helix-hairpin-helix domain-containing protein n=1 Tax=Hyphobacterium sp. TaxID=2004662 RepID=UPI003B516291